jgi:hypothetical protein
VDEHARAEPAERERNLAADSARRPRDERRAAGEVGVLDAGFDLRAVGHAPALGLRRVTFGR